MFTDWQHPGEIEPVSVYKILLRGPVTLGHVLLLDELGSPVVKGESFDIGELMIAAMVCAQPAEESRKDIRAWWMPWFLRYTARRCGALDFETEAKRFSAWFQEQCGGPRIDTGDEKQSKRMRPQSAPWYIARLALAVGELGMSVGDAEAMPVKRMNQLVGALIESRGDVKFLTEKTSNALEQIQQWEREMAEQETTA